MFVDVDIIKKIINKYDVADFEKDEKLDERIKQYKIIIEFDVRSKT